ncbi:MAG TPA: zinc finger domain-containing protein, partial [Terriglobales bacterium]|nr:zinc finger domain-containing protein [Terriglobales bacterium]
AASVLLAELPPPRPRDAALAERWERLLAVREAVNKALEDARQADRIGHSLDARVRLQASGELDGLLRGYPALTDLFITSQVELAADLGEGAVSPLLPELRVEIEKARGGKCERCWNYSEAIGSSSDHPGLCQRCQDVMRAAA